MKLVICFLMAGVATLTVPLVAWADQLSKVSVTSELVAPGRALTSIERGNFLIIDSVPPLDGPNVAINPTELFVGALASCATFVAKATLESGTQPFSTIRATVEGDFNAKSVKTGEGNPSFRAFRINYESATQDAKLQKAIRETLPKRCPVYATLERSAKIAVTFEPGFVTPPSTDLATVSVKSNIYKDGSRAYIQSRNHFLVIDSVAPLGGKNETVNPIDALLSAQAACVLFVTEASAKADGKSLAEGSVVVSGHFDPRGVKGEKVNPRIQKIEVTLNAPELDAATRSKALGQAKKRCPIYTTLSKSAEIIAE